MKFETYFSEQCAARYRSKGWWTGQTLLDDFELALNIRPRSTAVVDAEGRRMTFAQLDEESRRVAAGLVELGVERNDVVSIQLPNCLEFVTVHLAATRIGAVTNPLLTSYRENELSYMLRVARTTVVVVPDQYRGFDYPAMYTRLLRGLSELKKVVVVGHTGTPGMLEYADLCKNALDETFSMEASSGDEVSALLFTSGTESRPKAVVHSHNTMAYGTHTMAKLLGLTKDDVVWAPSPLGHATGFLWGMRQALTLGCKLVLQDVWDTEEALRLVEAERCTYSLVAAPFLTMLVSDPTASARDITSLRAIGCAGSPVPRTLGIEVEEVLGCRLIGMWGMSECFVGSASSLEDAEAKHWETDGRPMPGTELAVFDDTRTRILPPGQIGELATRGPHVALGYLHEKDLTAKTFSPEGWLFSNDLATLDADGYVRIVGRKKDIINRGGLKVSASEIECLLKGHPKVKEVAVVALPDKRLGEKGCAFVVPSGGDSLELEELTRYLEERGVARYKLPESLVIKRSFPTTQTGKIRKNALRESLLVSRQEAIE